MCLTQSPQSQPEKKQQTPGPLKDVHSPLRWTWVLPRILLQEQGRQQSKSTQSRQSQHGTVQKVQPSRGPISGYQNLLKSLVYQRAGCAHVT